MNDNQDPNPWAPNGGQQNWGEGGQQGWGQGNQPPQQNWGPGNQPPNQPPQQGWDQPQPPFDGSRTTWQPPASDPNQPTAGGWNGQQAWAGQGAPGGPDNQGGSGGPRKGLIIGIVAAVLVVAVGAAFFLTNRNKGDAAQAGSSASASSTDNSSGPITVIDDPQAALKDYFDAVVKGDPKRALSYGRNSPSGSSKYLTAEMMKAAQKKNPITDLQLEAETTSDYSTSVNVSYTIGTEPVTTTYRMSRQDKGSHWQMMQAAGSANLSRLSSDEITINGIKVAATEVALFPGGYTFDSGNPYIQYGTDDSTLYVKEPTSLVSTYDMSPALTQKGVNTWRSLVKQSLDTCLASHKIKPAGCPFYSPSTTTSGASIVEDSVNYTNSSSSSVDAVTPRIIDGTMQAAGRVYPYIKATAKARTSSGSIHSAGGTASVTNTRASVDFSAAKPAVTWQAS